MHFFIITTTIFLFFSHATLTLGMAIDSSTSVSKDEDFNSPIELDPQFFDAVDASRFDHTSNVDLTTQEPDLENSKNDGPDNDDSEDAGFNSTLSRRAVPPVICETSRASPWIRDIYDVADWMGNPKLQGEWDCKQKNRVKSKCTRVQWSGSAAAAICGRFGVYVSCRTLAEGVRAIADRCVHNELNAGGKIFYESMEATLIVYNSGK